MIGSIALLAGLAFTVATAWRLTGRAPPVAGRMALLLAIVAGVAAVAQWRAVGDSRWLVAAQLLIAAGLLSLVPATRRGVIVLALIAGLLGVALAGIATMRPKPAIVLRY